MAKTLSIKADGKIVSGKFQAGRRVTCRIVVDDVPVFEDTINPTSARGRKRLELEDHLLIPLIDKAMATGEAQTHTFPEAVDTRMGTLIVTVRTFDSPEGVDHVVTPTEALKLLATIPVDMLFCWKDAELLAMVDIDYHGIPAPQRIHLTTWVETVISPRPAAWHFSRGGGLHLFYTAAGVFSAEELAACAALRFRMIDGAAGIEMKKQTRGPGEEHVIIQPQQTEGTLSTWLGKGDEVDEDAVQEWLESHSMEIGRRYDHTFCPIDGGSDPGSREPVTVSTFGIYCHRCQGKGLVLGGRTPGFASFAALTKTPASSDIGHMIKNFVHWGHAKWVLGYKYNMPLDIAKLAYTAACKAVHGADDRIAFIHHRDTVDIARVSQGWKNIESAYVYPTASVSPIISAFPAAMNEECKPIASSVAFLSQGHCLSKRGFNDLNIIQGFSLSKQFLPTPPDAIIPHYPNKEIRDNPPRYLPGQTDKSEEAAWAVLETLVPGVDRRAVKAIMCATGSAQETRLGMAPMIFIGGGTGVAKTATNIFAMGILGTKAAGVQYHKEDERLKQSIKEAANTSGVCLANEFLKDSIRINKRNDPMAAFDSLLTVTPDTQSHVMYVGARVMGRLPPIIITEPHLPLQIVDYAQIARRIRYILLHGPKEWADTFAAIGLGVDMGHLFRAKSRELADAANVILSRVVDEFFSTPLTWDTMADRLGVFKLKDHPDLPNVGIQLVEFFKALCKAPEMVDRRQKRRHAEGFKLIKRNEAIGDEEEYLHDLYTDFSNPHDWHESTLLKERDWSSVVGCDRPVHMDMKTDNAGSVYFRFRCGPSREPTHLNGEIPCKILAQTIQ